MGLFSQRFRAGFCLLGLLVGFWFAPVLRGQDDREASLKRVEFSAREIGRIVRHSPVPSLQKDHTNRVSDDPRAALMGQYLFFDPRLSGNGKISCHTCHQPALGFGDGLPVAEGIGAGTRNAPTLLNVAHQRWLFWDGRSDSLWSQALFPIEDGVEMGGNRLSIAHLLFTDLELRTAYESIFGSLPRLSDKTRFPPAGRPVRDDPTHPHHRAWDGMTTPDQILVNRIFSNVGKVIAAYEKKLVTGDSLFDRFVAGLKSGKVEPSHDLGLSASRGVKLFMGKANCRSCHVGPLFTDGEFHDLLLPLPSGAVYPEPGRFEGVANLLQDPFNALGIYSDDREGNAAKRIEFMGQDPERYGEFKTPSLRNVARTAPYMHRGQFTTLAEVVAYYSTLEGARPSGHHQETVLVPLDLSKEEQADLVAFLETLTGADPPPELLVRPSSPLLLSND